MKKPTYSLKQAQADPKAMKQFIDEHADLEVEGERFERVMQSMTTGRQTTEANQTNPQETPSDLSQQ